MSDTVPVEPEWIPTDDEIREAWEEGQLPLPPPDPEDMVG